MAATEETPLLIADGVLKHEDIYTRFSPPHKQYILALVAFCGLLVFFISGVFVPSIPQIAKELNSTGPVISLAVSLSILATSIGALFGSTNSTYYGRRPIYLLGLPLLCAGSVGVATAQTVPTLMFWRFIQSFGAAPAVAVGAGVVGDIYKLEERGQSMGIFFGAGLLGLALAPLAGGLAAQYATWRVMQWILAAVGLFQLVLMFLLFPETSHPNTRGIDKAIAAGGDGRFRLINPLTPLALLKSPNIFAVSCVGFMVLFANYVLIVPIAYTIGARYGITNEAAIGACILPCGVGNMVGAPLAGRISDRVVIKWRAQRGGVWYPEDRLRATLIGALVIVPFSVLFAGLITEYVKGTVGLVSVMVCLFVCGVGADIVLNPIAAYCVDVMHERSAECLAANNALRSLLMSIGVASIFPSINTLGIVTTNALSALLAWGGFALLWFTIRYGAEMRAWGNIQYSTAESN